MDINRGSMESLFTGFKKEFMDGMNQVPSDYKEFVMELKSTNSSEAYPFMEPSHGMREWIGDRHIKNMTSKKLTVLNRLFEDTVTIPKIDILTDSLGLYIKEIGEMGKNARNIWPEIAMEAINDNGKWADGKAFFLTTRKYGSNTINNKTTSALSSTTFETGYTAMRSYKGANDKPMKVKPTHLIVGPSLRKTAWDIVKNTYVTDGETSSVQVENPNRNLVEMLVIDELVGDYASDWYLAACGGKIKPVAVQKLIEPKLTKMDREEDESVFMRGKFLYGTEAAGEAFLAFPHLMYGGRPSDA
jgi:phage major head subunit gpT-like protein